MKAFGIFGMLFGGSDTDKATDRKAIQAELEAEVDFIFDTFHAHLAKRRDELHKATTLETPQLAAESLGTIEAVSSRLDPERLSGAKLRGLAAELDVRYHHNCNDASIRRLIAEVS